MENLDAVKLTQDLKQHLAAVLGLTPHDRSHDSFYLEAPERVESDRIKSAIVTFLANEGYPVDAHLADNVLIFTQQKCWGWVTFSNFSGQEPFLVMVNVSDAPVIS